MTVFTVASGATSGGITLNDDDHLLVSSGGVASAAIVNDGGTAAVLAGGLAGGSVVNNGGNLFVSSGGVASGSQVNAGGTQTVLSGGLARGSMLDIGAEVVNSGGTTIGETVNGGGEYVSGVASGTILSAGAEYVYSGGAADFTVVSSLGKLFVFSGGVASGTVLSGGYEYAFSAGVVRDTVVDSAGVVQVQFGGVGSGTVVTTGGQETVMPGGISDDTTVNGGFDLVFGQANRAVLSGGNQNVYPGGVASGTVVRGNGANAFQDIQGGLAIATVVNSGGQETVHASGTADGVTVNSGGLLDVQAGGDTEGAIVFGSPGGTVLIEGATMPTGVIGGFAPGDTIDLAGIAASKAVYDPDSGIVSLENRVGGAPPVTVARLHLAGVQAGESLALNSDGNGGTSITVGTPSPDILVLAELSQALYSGASLVGGFVRSPAYVVNADGFLAEAFQHGNQIVLAIRGTAFGQDAFAAINNLLTGGMFQNGGVPTAGLSDFVTKTANLLGLIRTQNPFADITLTGHSLGGAVAQLLGDVSGYPTKVFDAPGAANLEAALTTALNPARLAGNDASGINENYRVYGDQVSRVGAPLGQIETILTGSPPVLPSWSLVVDDDDIATMVNWLAVNPVVVSGLPDPALPGLLAVATTAPSSVVGLVTSTPVAFAVKATAGSGVLSGIDPTGVVEYQIAGDPGSPLLNAFQLPVEPGVVTYSVSLETGLVWSDPMIVQPGIVVSEPSGFAGIRFSGLDGAGLPAAISGSIAYSVGFASAGLFVGKVTTVAGISGNTFEWQGGSGNFATAANWADTTAAVAGPPLSADEADFLTTGGTIAGTGSVAVLDFDGQSPWMVSGSLFATSEIQLGASAGIGTQLGVLPGGNLSTNGNLNLGVIATGNGNLTVSAGAVSAAAGVTVGDKGAGGLLIENAATLRSGGNAAAGAAQSFEIGRSASGNGTVTVTGAKSLLNNTGQFVVGDGGPGVLSIGSGGTVVTAPGTVAGPAGLVIGATAGSFGSSVNVSGTASRLVVTGLVDVGAAGSAALQLSGGATVTAGSLDAGIVSTAVGQISLSGSGTGLIISGDAVVADDGTGVLSVLSGATFAAASLTIGNTGNSSGAVVVSGNGSMINLSGALNVGTSLGTGDLTVGPGAAVHASVVNLQGQVVLEGGLLDPTVQLINQGQTVGGFGTIVAGDIIDEGVIQAGGTKPTQRLLIVQGTVLGGGTLTVNGVVQPSSAAGLLQINAGGTMELTGAVLNAVSTTVMDNLTPTGTYTVNNSVIDVTFADSTGVLLLDDIAEFAGTISADHTGDSFVITGGTLSNVDVLNGNTLTFSDSGTKAAAGGIDRIIFASAVTPAGFNIVNGNTVQVVACFAEGTLIQTQAGPVAVEALAVGDRVVTHDGQSEPIVWIGRRAVNCAAHPHPETVWPVRVRAGAFGPRTPDRDLHLSPDHAVFANGVLVPVKLLINGSSIAPVRQERVTYFHVELSRHAVILAEGLPVESYLDIGDRSNFQQPGEPIRLFPDFAARLAPDAAMVWETRGCAPLVLTGRELTAIRRHLEKRVQTLIRQTRHCGSGDRHPDGYLNDDPDLFAPRPTRATSPR